MNILDELIAKGVAGETIVKVAKLIAEVDHLKEEVAVLAERRAANRERMRAVRARVNTCSHTDAQEPALIIESKKDILSKERKGVRGKPKVPLPDDWQPKGPQRDPTEADEFRDNARANGRMYSDWHAAYQQYQRHPVYNHRNKPGWQAPSAAVIPINETPAQTHARIEGLRLEQLRQAEEKRVKATQATRVWQDSDWAQRGPVTLQNYDLRAEFYLAKIPAGNPHPYLRLPGKMEVGEATADYPAWMEYFQRHLGGFSQQVQMFLDGILPALSVPTQTPEEFDQHFLRKAFYIPPKQYADQPAEELTADRQRIAQRILKEYRAALDSHEGEPYNVFVPTFAPQYADMVARGGKPGVSLEDKNRTGVWVPHRWITYEEEKAKKAPWKRMSDDQLRAMYGKRDGPQA